MSVPLFTLSTEIPRVLPPAVWRSLRWIGVAAGLGIAVTGLLRPAAALTAFWFVFVPLVPLLFLVAPGLWRNTCPMASLNQLPRALGFTRGLTVPPRVAAVAPLISAGLFLAIVPLRRVWLDGQGQALGTFLLAMLGLAFTGGVLFKGKSGWCSQFCPMLSVERFYNLAPLLLLSNDHCRPCVGCTRNCYDVNPTAAHLADLGDDDPRWSGYRTAVAGLVPWLIVAFYTMQPIGSVTPGAVAGVYGRLLLFCAAGIGTFQVIETSTRVSRFHVVVLHVVAAINLFYWYTAPRVLGHFGITAGPAAHLVQGCVALISLGWLARAWPRERAFAASDAAPRSGRAGSTAPRAAAVQDGRVDVTFAGGPTVVTRVGETLLDVAERSGVRIQAGCRMGMCGADPVRIVGGAENLDTPTGTERATLQRVDAGEGCRMACVARPTGPVRVSLDLTATAVADGDRPAGTAPRVALAPGVRRVVVVGTGAAGITAVTELRRLHPDLELTIVGSEPHDFYNRMDIGRLVDGQTAVERLAMLPQDWAESRAIRLLRGVTAVALDRDARTVVLDTGERLGYDRVIVATGGRSTIPPVEGFGMQGTYVLRTVDDGVGLQRYVRRHRCISAVVIGGGLLGIEAASCMCNLGVRTHVLDRNPHPLSRQLDPTAGALLRELMKDLGIEIIPGTSATRLLAGVGDRLAGVELTDGRVLHAGVCLAAAGVTPHVELAAAAGLTVGRGIVVDDRMATSDPDIFAAGDCIEHRGRTYGLWPACLDHARVAAVNALGGDLRYGGEVPSCRLKVAGVHLLSAGEMSARSDRDEEIRFHEAGDRGYRKLVIRDGEIRGAMLIGHPDLADRVSTAVAERTRVAPIIESLRAGEWTVLAE